MTDNPRDGDAERPFQAAVRRTAADILAQWTDRDGGMESDPEFNRLELRIAHELERLASDARDAALRDARAENRRLRDLLQGAAEERDKQYGMYCEERMSSDIREKQVIECRAEIERLRQAIVARDIEIQSHKAEISWRINLMNGISSALADKERETIEACARVAEAWMDETTPKRIRALAALDAAVPDEWRPIETAAPASIDDTFDVWLVCTCNGLQTNARRAADAFYDGSAWRDADGDPLEWTDEIGQAVRVTHWRPLPPPPAPREGEAT